MTDFTPGPWYLLERPGQAGGKKRTIAPRPDGQFAIAQMFGDPRPAATNHANGLLLAAAPDLLAACECAANVLSLLSGEVGALGLHADEVPEKLSAAIAKAKGESP